MKRLIGSSLAVLLLFVSLLACAADGYVTGNVNMRAGPDTGYPLVATLPAGTPVSVQGCTTGWEWCDVIAYDNRGWVAGNFIQYDYAGQPVLLPTYAVRIGIPIVSFVISSYWDSYYRNRPFYHQRTTWYHRRMPHHPPPRPLYAKPRPVHVRPAHPAPRPQPRPPVNHKPPAGHKPPTSHKPPAGHKPPTGHKPQARPPQHAQQGKPPMKTGSSKRPSPSASHGKPAQNKKPAASGTQQH
jgi:uncharacterized protein YraI